MIRSLLVFVAVMIIAFNTKGQVSVGPEIGTGSSNMFFTPPPVFTNSYAEPQSSQRAGVLVDIPAIDHFTFQAGLYVSSKGSRLTYYYYISDSLCDSEEEWRRLTYLDMPLSLVFKTSQPGKNRIFVGVGGYVSLLVGGRSDYNSNYSFHGHQAYVTNQTPATQVMEAYDFGGSYYIGYELKSGIYFKGYFSHALRNSGLRGDVAKNLQWGVGAGWLFGRKPKPNYLREKM
jgi:hypothetical protein